LNRIVAHDRVMARLAFAQNARHTTAIDSDPSLLIVPGTAKHNRAPDVVTLSAVSEGDF
jgi:hypothetical protein